MLESDAGLVGDRRPRRLERRELAVEVPHCGQDLPRKRGSVWIAGRGPAPHTKTALSHSAWTRLRLAHTTHSHCRPSKEEHQRTSMRVTTAWPGGLSCCLRRALPFYVWPFDCRQRPTRVAAIAAWKRLVVPRAVSRPDRFCRKTSTVLRAALCALGPPAMSRFSMAVVAAPLAAPSRRSNEQKRTHLHQ